MKEWNWDAAPLVAYAFAVQPKTYREIDALYESKFDDYFMRNPWRDSRLFRRDSADVEIYAKKILGITQYIYETNDEKLFAKLCSIAQKHFEAYYKYISRQSKKIPLIKFLSDLNFRTKTHSDIISTFGILLLFIKAQDKMTNIAGDENKAFYRMIGEMLYRFNRPITSYINKENNDHIQFIFTSQQNKYGKIFSLKDFISSPHYINNQLYVAFEKVSELDDLPLESLQRYTYSEQELLEIFAIYAAGFPALNLLETDTEKLFCFFITALIIRSYARKYNEAKQRIVEQTEQLNAIVDTATIQSKLTQEIKKNRRLASTIAAQEVNIQKLHCKINLQEASLTEKINHATKTQRETIAIKQRQLNDAEIEKTRQISRIHKLEKQIVAIKNKTDVLNDQNQNLQNIISGLSTANTPHAQIRLDSMQGKKVVVIGGHPQWIAKLQLACPNYIYISADKLHFDPLLLKNAELIAICYLHMNHAIFRKTIAYARKHQIPVGYVKYIRNVLYFFN